MNEHHAKPPMQPANWVRRIRPEELPKLVALAEEDKHAIVAATHVFLKHGELVGYASIGAVALVLPWFDTKQCHAEDSFYYGNAMENIVALAGGTLMCVPFVPHSPFHPYIERLGYQNAGQVSLTFKKVS